jgi:cation transport regulator ChaC
MKIYIFGYGSLMSAKSASKTLKRNITLDDLIPITVQGYRRLWSLKERVFSVALEKEVSVAFLDIEPDLGAMINGTLMQINQGDFDYLRIREKNYKCIDITQAALFEEENCQIYTFVASEEHKIHDTNKQDVYIMRRYVNLVESACEKFGVDFVETYKTTTLPTSLPILDGDYHFVDPEQRKSV